MKKKLPLSFAEKLRIAREHREMSKNELAKQSGLSQPYITALENGDRKEPSFVVVEKLCKALNAPLKYFADDDQVPLNVLVEYLPPDLQEFVRNQENIPLIEIAKDCVELDLSPEALRLYVQALAKARDLSNNVTK